MMEIVLPEDWSFHFDGATVTIHWDEDPNGELLCNLREKGDVAGLCHLYWELMSQMLNGVSPDAPAPADAAEEPVLAFYRARFSYWRHRFYNL